MFITFVAKTLHVLSYTMWVLFPFLVVTEWFIKLFPCIGECWRSTLLAHEDLKEQILLWYLKKY